MTTMLERAARAVREAGPDSCIRGLSLHESARIARAVLMAVREPDDAMIDAGLIAPHAMFEAALPHETFPLMIDKILSETP